MDTSPANDLFLFGGFRLDRHSGGLFRQDAAGIVKPVAIGARALDVLAVLVAHQGALVSKQAIMQAVWPGIVVDEKNLAVQISSLRRILDAGHAEPSCIQTEAGRGYRFVARVTRLSRDDASVGPRLLSNEDAPAPEALVFDAGVHANIPRLAHRPIDVFRVHHAAETARSKLALPRLTRRLAIAAAVLLVMVGTGTGAWFWRTHTMGNPPPRLSLVVLPFEYVGSDATDDYLAAGITNDLTTALSHIPGTMVIARATAYTYRGKAEDIRRIGQDLGVRYVVRGSVQRLGAVLRVNSELASTETGAQLWSDGFDQTIADLAAGQEQIVIRMRTALNIRLVDIEAARGLRERPTDPDAYDLILRARALSLLPSTKDTTAKALALFEQGLERDPNSVLALAGAAGAVMNLYGFDAMPYEAAMDRAVQYIERALKLEPNSEAVLGEYADIVDYQQGGLDRRRAQSKLEAAAQKLLDYFPNNPAGHHELGVLRRNQGRYEECAELFERAIRLSPRSSAITSWSFSMAYCKTLTSHDREALAWADRSMAAGGQHGWWRQRLLAVQAAAYLHTGDIDSAKRVARELNDLFPYYTWRVWSPDDPGSQKNAAEFRSFQDALKAAGVRDHVDPDADFGVAPVDVLHLEFWGKTPTIAPGVTTVSTAQLVGMLRDTQPLLIDTMSSTWYRSIPGAVGLYFNGNTHGGFTDEVQKRLEAKLHELTGGDITKPIVAVGWSSESFDGYNLTLRVRHAGYANVYWYRGGREAWEVAGMPEDMVRPAVW